MNRYISNVVERVVFGITSFVLVLSTVTAAVPVFLTQTANAITDTVMVSTLTGLKEAFADSTVTSIGINANISTNEKLVLTHPVYINGNRHTITFTDDLAGWKGNYVLQAYSAGNVTVHDLNLTGGDAGLLVNGTNVTLTGSVDLSGNAFGGIEVSKGVGVDSMPLLTNNALLTNSTEAYGLPTIWEDGISGTVTANSLTRTATVKPGQVQYYTVAANATKASNVTTLDQLKAALADSEVGAITLTADITTSEKLVLSHSATIDGNGHTITFTGDLAGWKGNYVLQAYKAGSVTIMNLKLTGGDAGLLVNGSTVTLDGTSVNVSGNEFGGIEVSMGSLVTTTPLLTVDTTLVNTTEKYGLPTIWEDGITGTVVASSLTPTSIVKVGQVQYYLTPARALPDVATPAVVPAIVPTPATQVAPVTPIVGAAPYATTPVIAATVTTADGEVLGASTAKADAPAVAGAETSKDVVAEPIAKDGFNSAWYWLLTIPVAGSAWWALAAFRRRES